MSKTFSYFRGEGYDKLECCGTNKTCELCNGKWYPYCKLGYKSSKDCSVCTKTHSHNKTQHKTSFWTYIFIAAVVIVILYFFYRLFTAQEITENTVPDLIFGEPGVSDPVSVLKDFAVGEPVYYV